MASERDNEADVKLNISRNPSAGVYSYVCQIRDELKQGSVPFGESLSGHLAQVFEDTQVGKEVLVTSVLRRGIALNRNEAFLTPTQLRKISDELSEIRSDLYFALTSPRPTLNES